MQKPWVQSLGWEDPVEEGMATHSSILDWRIPWTEEPSGLPSIGLQRVRHDWSNSKHTHTHTHTHTVIAWASSRNRLKTLISPGSIHLAAPMAAVHLCWMPCHSLTLYLVQTESTCQAPKSVSTLTSLTHAYLQDIVGSVPGHHNKASISIKWVTEMFWFSSTYESYTYTIL